MQEDFLHYIWRFRKFDFHKAKTVSGNPVTVIHPGTHNFNSGPDFFNAKVKIGEQLWAGNVEIHIKSSDWYAHHHETDPAYDNIILHVVWQDDVEIFRKDNSIVPTVELKHLVKSITLDAYNNLLLAPNARWINCENDFHKFVDFEVDNWLERIYFERLQEKQKVITGLLQTSGNNWEETLFKLLAKNFGLNVNGNAFLSMAQSLPFHIIRKTRDSAFSLESLFLGQAGLLEERLEEVYYQELQKEYQFLKRKYLLENKYVERPKFFRLRPDNFPNIRLSQLSSLYNKVPHLFSDLMRTNEILEIYKILKVETSDYWKTHYSFKKSHSLKLKQVTRPLMDLLIINTIVPFRFTYQQLTGTGNNEDLLEIMAKISPEKNTLVNRYNKTRPGTAENAMQSQALLHLKREYCDKNMCLACNLGAGLLQGNRE